MKKQLLKKLCVVALGVIGLSVVTNAQEHWLASISGPIPFHSGEYLGKRLAVDAAGNTYSTGAYAASTTVGNTWANAYSNGQTGENGVKAFVNDLINIPGIAQNSAHNAFVAKTNDVGEFEWMLGFGPTVKSAAKPFTVAIANTVAVDDVNSAVYIGGYFAGVIDYYYKSASVINFSPGNISTTGAEDTDGLLMKLSKTGNYVWHKTFSSTSANSMEAVRDVRTDAAGNLIVVGSFTGELKINGTAVLIEGEAFKSKGGSDGFIAKFDTNGNLLFIKSIGGTASDVAYAVTIDPIDNSIYATGSANYGTATTISVDGVNFPAAIGTSTWLVKFDADGVVRWGQSISSTTARTKIAYDITVDKDSDPSNRGLYIAGTVAKDDNDNSNNIYDFGGIGLPIAVNTSSFPFFAKFKADDGSGVWAKVFPSGDASTANVITVNDNKEVFAGGVVLASMKFETAGIADITTTVGNDGYIVKFNGENGNVVGAKILSTLGGDRVMGLVATNSVLYVNGQAGGTTVQRTTENFGGTGQEFYYRPGNGSWNTFVMKWNSTTLPVSLTEFKGSKTSLGNLLSWTTLSETDNQYFELERSRDGVNFSFLKRVAGAGTSTEKLSYSYLDTEPLEGVNYYRLKQVDKDGAYSYSENIVAINSQLSAEGLKLYPNPGLGIVNIQLPSEVSGAAINVYSQAGKLVKSYSDVSGSTHAVNISEQAAGVYFIQVIQKGKSDFIKYIKQ